MAITLQSISSADPVAPFPSVAQLPGVAASQGESSLLSNPSVIVTLTGTSTAPLTYNSAGLFGSQLQIASTFLRTLGTSTAPAGTIDTSIFDTLVNTPKVESSTPSEDTPLQLASTFLATLGTRTTAAGSTSTTAISNTANSSPTQNNRLLASVNSTTAPAGTIGTDVSDTIVNTSNTGNTTASAINTLASTSLAETAITPTTTTPATASARNLNLDLNAQALNNIAGNPAYAYTVAGYMVNMANPHVEQTVATPPDSAGIVQPTTAAQPVKKINTYA